MHKSSCPTLCFIMLKISETACCGSGAPLSANFHPANQLRQLHCNHSAFDQLAYAQTAALLCLGLLWLPTGCDRSTAQGDHSRDNVKFPDNSMTVRGTPAHVKCYSYHAGTSVSVSGGGRNATVHDPKPNEMHKFSKVKNGRKYAAYNEQF